MRVTFVIPTLGEREHQFKRLLHSFLEQDHPSFELIIVSQKNHAHIEAWLKSVEELSVTHLRMDERGLSKARNQAWPYINGEYVTFSDDDCWYPSNAVSTILTKIDAASDNCNAICFQIYDPLKDVPYKNYQEESLSSIGRRDLFRKSSIELVFNTSAIQSIQFNERFGLGAPYPSGEENLFLHEFTYRRNVIAYYPEVLVYHEKPATSSRLSEKQLVSKGPLFKAMFSTPVAFLLVTAFFIKKATWMKHPLKHYVMTVRELFRFQRVERDNMR